ncbi:MAG: TrmH family RNA methyltransferase [Phycisphaerales bacterium]
MTTIAADPADPRLAPYRGVRDADLRGRDGLCCVETPRVVARFLASALRARERGGEARDALPCVPRSVLCAPRGLESLADLLRRLPEVDVFLAPDDRTVTEISGYGLHSGALAIGVRRDEPVPSSLAGEDGTLAACDGVVHTDNLGAIFRNAASFGAAGVLLSPNSSDPLLRKTIRVAMGRVFDVPWARARDWPQALWDLRARHGFRIVAAEDAPGAVDVGTLSPAPRTVVVFGAEGAGVSKAILEGADAVARVPMSTRGGTLADDPPSLNVAVASAVMLDRLCAR